MKANICDSCGAVVSKVVCVAISSTRYRLCIACSHKLRLGFEERMQTEKDKIEGKKTDTNTFHD